MAHLFVPAALAAACIVAGVWAYSLYRRERAEMLARTPTDTELYAQGKSEAALRARESRSALAGLLHEAGVDASPAAWLAGTAAMSIVSGALLAVLSANALMGAAAGCGALLWRVARVEASRRRRRQLLDVQLARMLPHVAASVRSSLTLERAIRVASAHAEDPLREGLVRVLADAAYGTTLAESFEDLARRTGSPDIRALAAAIRIQQKFGGAIAPALDMIADHADARLKASRELRTELAGTKLAKWFVAASMPAIFLIMFATNADFARFYAEEPLGWAVMAAAAVSEAFGLAACRRITSCGKEGAR